LHGTICFYLNFLPFSKLSIYHSSLLIYFSPWSKPMAFQLFTPYSPRIPPLPMAACLFRRLPRLLYQSTSFNPHSSKHPPLFPFSFPNHPLPSLTLSLTQAPNPATRIRDSLSLARDTINAAQLSSIMNDGDAKSFCWKGVGRFEILIEKYRKAQARHSGLDSAWFARKLCICLLCQFRL
jgi:hypothetical protein